MGQLQGNLDEGIGAGPALLYLAFSKLGKGNDVGINIVSQVLGNCEGVLNDLLALKEKIKSINSFLIRS